MFESQFYHLTKCKICGLMAYCDLECAVLIKVPQIGIPVGQNTSLTISLEIGGCESFLATECSTSLVCQPPSGILSLRSVA